MVNAMSAQVLWGRQWNIGELAILIIVIAAIVAVVWAALQHFGIGVPPLLVRVFWIIVAAFICVLAIRIIMTM